jgi:hypothetical protein
VLAAPPFHAYLLAAPLVYIDVDDPPEVIWVPDPDGYATNAQDLRFPPLEGDTPVVAVCVRDATGRELCCIPPAGCGAGRGPGGDPRRRAVLPAGALAVVPHCRPCAHACSLSRWPPSDSRWG